MAVKRRVIMGTKGYCKENQRVLEGNDNVMEDGLCVMLNATLSLFCWQCRGLLGWPNFRAAGFG
jgi:hypothetical protein